MSKGGIKDDLVGSQFNVLNQESLNNANSLNKMDRNVSVPLGLANASRVVGKKNDGGLKVLRKNKGDKSSGTKEVSFKKKNNIRAKLMF